MRNDNVNIQFYLKLIRQSYELKKKKLLICQTNIQKMTYYQFNRQENLQKAKENILKKKLPTIKNKTKKL